MVRRQGTSLDTRKKRKMSSVRATRLVEAPSGVDIEETSEDLEEAELDEARDLMEEDIDIDEDDPA
jgi:hypothetical protein